VLVGPTGVSVTFGVEINPIPVKGLKQAVPLAQKLASIHHVEINPIPVKGLKRFLVTVGLGPGVVEINPIPVKGLKRSRQSGIKWTA